MTYANKFVVSVKCRNEFLREIEKDTVKLPFDSEYSIYLKNLNSKKCQVSIDIDGRGIGRDIIIDPNASIELERFTDGSMEGGDRFKFIEKTKEEVARRGDRGEDGIIRVKYTFEKHYPMYNPYNTWTTTTTYRHYPQYPTWHTYIDQSNNPYVKGMYSIGEPLLKSSGILRSSGTSDINSCSVYSASQQASTEGITEHGGRSNQSFDYGYIGELETQSEVIVFKLVGYKDDSIKVVDAPITVKDKLYCVNCGKANKTHHKFCSECGTKLER